MCNAYGGLYISDTIALADFGKFLGWFADRTILLMKNHPLLGGASLISCLLLNLRSQASRCIKQTTPTGRQLGLFATSHCYYVMLVKSEVFQARHIYLDAAFRRSVPRVSLKSRNLVTGRYVSAFTHNFRVNVPSV